VIETLSALADGLHQLLTWPTPLFLVAGVIIGFIVGVLPGLGGAAAMAFLLPAILPLPAIDGLVLITATAAVATCAGDLTSILLGIPGESTAAAIIADGHALTLQGEGGRAAGAALMASVMGSWFGVAVLVVGIPIARPLLDHVQSPELALLGLLGVGLVVPLSRANPIKGYLSGALGLAIATVGLDRSGVERFTFGFLPLADGLGILPFALGMFAIPEALAMLRSRRPAVDSRGSSLGVGAGAREAIKRAGLVARCGAIGAAIGVLPGVGAAVSQWIAYGYAAQRSRHPEAFGKGAIEGVIGPASATTATLGGAMVPTLAIGIPGSLATSFLLSGFILKGLVPGPALLSPGPTGQLTLVFALIWCVVVASALGAIVGWLSLGVVARLAGVRPARLFVVVLALILVGTVGDRLLVADLVILFVLGCAGFVLSTLGWPRAPLMLGFVLGPMIERRLAVSQQLHEWSALWRPSVLSIAAVAAAYVLVRIYSGRRAGADPRPRRGASAGDVPSSAGLVVLSAAALWMTRSWITSSAFMPRVAFGATMALAIVALVSAWRRAPSERTSLVPVATADNMARLGWLACFTLSAWALGVVGGVGASALLYFRWEARESWPVTLGLTSGVVLLTWSLVAGVIGRLI
jgi:TctA family transporter